MLAYDLPTDPSRTDFVPSTDRGEALGGFSALDIVQLLWRRRISIVAIALAGAVAALVIGKSLTPKYSATAQLYVDPRELQLVDRELSAQPQDASNLPMIVESQARLFTSSSVLLRVVDSEHLENDPEFGGGHASGGLAGLFASKPSDPNGARTAALDALVRHVNVKRTDRTFIVEVDVWSSDPVKAATLANAVASAYLSEASKVQTDSAHRATADLSGRLTELEQRLRQAENRVAAYKAENNFVGTQDTLVSDQQLSEVNARLGAARAATLDAQARYDQITASIRSSGDGGATVETLRSPTIAGLRTQYAEARRRQAELVNELGPRHPAIKSMETQVADLKKNIGEEIARYVQSAQNDVTRARDYESGLVRALDSMKRQSLTMSQASVRLRELERDVEASRGVYQAFLKRSRETQEQEQLNTSNARITSGANVPQRRTFPPGMGLLMMVGFILGAGSTSAYWLIVDRFKAVLMRSTASTSDIRATETPYHVQQTVSGLQLGAPTPMPTLTMMDKPLITRLQHGEVDHRAADYSDPSAIDINRLGWPTLRVGGLPGVFAEAMREMRVSAAKQSSASYAPILAVVSATQGDERSVSALNVALAAANDGIDVLLIDADLSQRRLSRRLEKLGISGQQDDASASGLGSPVETINHVTVLPNSPANPAVTAEAVRVIVEHARATTECGLIILDGPAAPFQSWDKIMLEFVDGVLAVLPAHLDINDSMEETLHALNTAQRKLLAVIVTELNEAGAVELKEHVYA